MLERRTLHQIYEDYAPAMIHVVGKTSDGDWCNGAAFHVGNGIVVSARHVFEDPSDLTLRRPGDDAQVTVRSLHFPDNPNIDLGLALTDLDYSWWIKCVRFPTDPRRQTAKTGSIPLGFHLDEWIGDEFVLSKALVMGFPPIPLSREPHLVAASAEVNAVVDRYDAPHPHFALSYLPRGGFSGGPVISEFGFLLGVVTSSLIEQGQPSELGFGVAITVEPLLQLMASIGARPRGFSDDEWQDFAGR